MIFEPWIFLSHPTTYTPHPSSLIPCPHGLIPHTLSLTPGPSSRIFTEKITHDKFCRIMEKKKMKIWNFFLFLANKILDPDPHKNILDPPHWSLVLTFVIYPLLQYIFVSFQKKDFFLHPLI